MYSDKLAVVFVFVGLISKKVYFQLRCVYLRINNLK